MNNPLVSIIIPLYNNSAFVSETISSAIAQTWANIEIIVVDDGSTDDSYALAKAFESKGPVTVYKRVNQGATAARNFGFQKSKGDYIQYLDADDKLSANKIEKQLDLLGTREPGVLSSCPWAMFTDDVARSTITEEEVWKDMQPVDWLVCAWNGGGMMQTACWLTPRYLVEAAGPWNETLKKNPNDDGEFFCRVILKSKGIKFCKEALVYYRTHSGPRVSRNTSRSSVESLLGTCLSYQERIFEVEHSSRTKQAVARNYALFIYQFDHLFPDLGKLAFKYIKDLQLQKQVYAGGENFIRFSKLVGFRNALLVKKWAYLLKANRG